MAKTPDKKFYITRNLKDAGCDAATIERFLQLEAEGNADGQMHLLAKQKASLLDQLHGSQEKIDCLDYLVYSMKAKTKTEGKPK